MVRRYEMEKALGKKNLTSKDIMNYNPAEYERVDAKDSVVDKVLKVDRTELKKKEPDAVAVDPEAAEARRLEKQQKKQQKKQDAAKKAYEEDRTKAYLSGNQMFRGQGGRATGGLVKKKQKKKRR